MISRGEIEGKKRKQSARLTSTMERYEKSEPGALYAA